MRLPRPRGLAPYLALCFAGTVFAQSGSSVSPAEEGIPVTDPLVIAKCASCHARDQRGNMERISWERTTPEGWQDALKRMILANGVTVSPAEARAIVKYLSASHGLAPEEAKPVMYEVERRIHDEANLANEDLRTACAKCHSFARPLSWRRSKQDWKQLADTHATRYKLPANDAAVTFFAQTAALHTPEWNAWSTRTHKTNLTGRWLVTASLLGRGKYYGEMQVDPAGDDEFNTSVRLTSVNDGSSIVRSGRSLVFGAYAWRGRSKGSGPVGNVQTSSAADDPSSEAREVLWVAPDQSSAEGRWFWGHYQEFGFDVKMRRAVPGPALLLVDQGSLKTGSQANRIRVIGDHFPDQVTPADLDFGPGVTVRRVVSHTASEVVAELDVAADAAPGKRNVALRGAVAPGAMAIYDRIDYIKVTPESAMAAFGDQTYPRGYQQFEAIGYQRGADGKLRTADDVELGPVDVNWSMEVFYATTGSSSDYVGKVSPAGFFEPAPVSPKNNFDVWVVATAKSEKDNKGKPMIGKAYLVVTIPTYTFSGRRYVRDLDRWVDDGPAKDEK